MQDQVEEEGVTRAHTNDPDIALGGIPVETKTRRRKHADDGGSVALAVCTQGGVLRVARVGVSEWTGQRVSRGVSRGYTGVTSL